MVLPEGSWMFGSLHTVKQDTTDNNDSLPGAGMATLIQQPSAVTEAFSIVVRMLQKARPATFDNNLFDYVFLFCDGENWRHQRCPLPMTAEIMQI